jgi:hypothetical protein
MLSNLVGICSFLGSILLTIEVIVCSSAGYSYAGHCDSNATRLHRAYHLQAGVLLGTLNPANIFEFLSLK